MDTNTTFETQTQSHFFKATEQAQIHYEIIDNILPEDTFFIHGNLASNRWWYPTIFELKKINSTQTAKTLQGRMILAEFRGCGKSSAQLTHEEINIPQFTNDFLALLDYLEIKKINIVGHSTGGIIACLMMSQRPALFNKALLLDPVGARGLKNDINITETFNRMKKDKRLVAFVLASTIYHNNNESAFFRNMLVEDAFVGVQNIGPLVIESLKNFNIEKELINIKSKTLILHGSEDFVLDIRESKHLHSLIINSDFKEIQNHGHSLNVEDPGRFCDILLNFLNIP